ncbi:NAD-dependent epimerase [Iodidimonas muriae]|uniref:NAD-dependent epimerase n=1 Tax=Iodidimonas muriae TaxID=261467 RepID=A0ABQ2LD44_9PROT|nr:NAD-dependent epimerase [Iodidimonas muriae]GER07260.1 NAD-dependent epimerase [Kordiimonadales bacterium JCM 17843]GGO11245.1 NAD-dependent epimerase [Iodidimonas muriae]
MKILVTGAAGFIGSHVSLYLLARGDDVVGLDNLNDYYDPTLKQKRLDRIAAFCDGRLNDDIYPEIRTEKPMGRFTFHKLDLADRDGMAALFAEETFDRVVHLAAQAGVRYSIDDPFAYVDSNITGFLTVLEGCRHHNVEHLVYASTSSVYGSNTHIPFTVSEPADHPVAFYGATKRANELMAHSYSHLFALPTTGLRFFTVYGPWGRPDMALFKFTKAILEDQPIDVFNYGHHKRDFTYIDDIVKGVVASLDHVARPDPDWDSDNPASDRSKAPWRVFNIGNERPVELMRYIGLLEEALGKEAQKNLLPLQPGDVPDTYADVSSLVAITGYRPDTPVEEGVKRFVDWYRSYYGA